MKTVKIIFITLLLSLVMGFIFLFLGALYGGNFGFFKLWGLVGYESAGVFFGLVGLVAGAVLGLYLSLRKK